MEKDSNLNIRIDSELKSEAEKLFADLGFNMSTAINIFLRQSIREHGIPFPVVKNVPNYDTINALNEANLIAEDTSYTTYDKVEDLYKDLDL